MESTASRATVLAKLLGFYTVEIRNLESGNVQSKADLLVMENLFYERNIVKKFDLKGIHGRKVKAASDGNNKTFFDGDWIEGEQLGFSIGKKWGADHGVRRPTANSDPRPAAFESAAP
jgi:1-phosphatidylinositol-3-phosphate 5-kinase